MRNRPARWALALVILLALSGCSSLFDKEYYAVEAYEAPAEASEQDDDAVDAISGYSALLRAISRLVAEHVPSAQLQFQGYDGSIQQDISTACWEVKSSTALGAFAVDYISYDLSRIVSYYQAQIYITYKRSAWQAQELERLANMAALSARLDRAIREGETYLVLQLAAVSASAGAVRDAVERAYYADPLACPVLPETETGIFPESGVDHILEISLDYGMDGEELSARRQALSDALGELTAPSGADEGGGGESEGGDAADRADRAYALCRRLAEECVYEPGSGGTAWDALVEGAASSEGLAMAFKAACQAEGLTCAVVRGRLEGESHAWNIVTLDGASYHVDVSNWAAGEDAVFLVGDEALWGAYWWDTSQYPPCGESFGYFEPAMAETSDEPEPILIES